MVDPLLLYNLAAQMLECARVEVANLEHGAPKMVNVMPGQPAFDNCCEATRGGGQLYAYVESVFPTDDFPVIAATPFQVRCYPPFIAVNVVVGIIRCTPTLTEGGEPPTAAALDANARIVLADQYAVWRGVLCCLARLEDDDELEAMVTSSTTLIPQGGCAGSELRVQLGDTDPCVCPEP